MKRFFTAAASFLVCFLCLTGPSRATGQELTVIMKSPPMHLNNAVTSSTQTIQIATQLFASPLRYDLDWNPEPYLASSWSFSEDKKSLTLHLVPDAVFHDGKPVTSEDVAFSIMAIKANHPFKTMFEPVEAVTRPIPTPPSSGSPSRTRPSSSASRRPYAPSSPSTSTATGRTFAPIPPTAPPSAPGRSGSWK